MPDEEQIEREYQENQRKKEETTRKVEGVAGTALAGAGCLYYVLLPFSFILLCILVIWIFGVFND